MLFRTETKLRTKEPPQVDVVRIAVYATHIAMPINGLRIAFPILSHRWQGGYRGEPYKPESNDKKKHKEPDRKEIIGWMHRFLLKSNVFTRRAVSWRRLPKLVLLDEAQPLPNPSLLFAWPFSQPCLLPSARLIEQYRDPFY